MLTYVFPSSFPLCSLKPYIDIFFLYYDHSLTNFLVFISYSLNPKLLTREIFRLQTCLIIPLHEIFSRLLFPITVVFKEGFMSFGSHSCQLILYKDKIIEFISVFIFLVLFFMNCKA